MQYCYRKPSAILSTNHPQIYLIYDKYVTVYLKYFKLAVSNQFCAKWATSEFALWHPALKLSYFFGFVGGFISPTKQQSEILTALLLFLSEWEVFQLKAIKEKSCFCLWGLLIFCSLTGKWQLNLYWIQYFEITYKCGHFIEQFWLFFVYLG